MNTGDLLLFQSSFSGYFGWWTYIVSVVTRSRWTHVAMILKDPTYIHPDYIGDYVIECGSERWAKTIGVIVSPLRKIVEDDSYKVIAHRRLIRSEKVLQCDMNIVYTTVMDKPYDTNPGELLGNELQSKWLCRPREMNKFVCSTLVAYMYTALGLLPKNTSWFFYQPWHFSSENARLFMSGCHLGKEEILKGNKI